MDRTNKILVGIAGFLIGAACIGFGMLISTPDDSCRQAFSLAEQALKINTEILKASADGIRASQDDDNTAARAATDRMNQAINQLNQLQPEYDKAATQCRKQ